tara:strand:+ start:72 stop:608 length:537 start_codon:yes stop_codon:yes gene_type:complete
MKLDYQDICPTRVWHISECDENVVKDMYDWALTIPSDYDGVKKSNRGGYHSPVFNTFDNVPHMEILQLALISLPAFTFVGWWMNINNKGDYNLEHVHPDCHLSGIWYFTDNNNSLELRDPNGFNRYKLNNTVDDFHETYHWDCKAGDMVIFPSDVSHSVDIHTLDTPRVSMAFNLKLS